MVRDSKLDFLSNVRLFASLNKKELALVSRVSYVVSVPAGTDVVKENTPGHEFYLLLKGRAVVRRNGRKIADLGPGDYFGEMALLDHGPRSATVVAETDLEALVIGQREFLGITDEVPALAHKLLVLMASRLREADSKAYSH
ncbi:MAG: cyclic nucleotide-binding domain-containing protein [Acidimicrobiales bacterium]